MKRPTPADAASIGRLLANLVEPVLKETVKDSVREVLEEEGLTGDTGDTGGESGASQSGRSRRRYPVGALVVLLIVVGVAYAIKRKGQESQFPGS